MVKKPISKKTALIILVLLILVWFVKNNITQNSFSDLTVNKLDQSIGSKSDCLGGTCIAENFAECTKFEKTFQPHENIDMEIKGEIIGKEGNLCIVKQTVVIDNTPLGFKGKEMICKLPLGDQSASVEEYCQGSLIDAIKEVSI